MNDEPGNDLSVLVSHVSSGLLQYNMFYHRSCFRRKHERSLFRREGQASVKTVFECFGCRSRDLKDPDTQQTHERLTHKNIKETFGKTPTES